MNLSDPVGFREKEGEQEKKTFERVVEEINEGE
jgi:hypothetical protein